MKYTLLLSMIVFCANLFGQSRKTTHTAKVKYRDSVSYEMTSDTLYGFISYNQDNGTIQGDGIIVKQMQWEYHTTVPTPPPSYTIKGKDTIAIWEKGGTMGMGSPQRTIAYIQTGKGYSAVFEKYVFTPKIK